MDPDLLCRPSPTLNVHRRASFPPAVSRPGMKSVIMSALLDRGARATLHLAELPSKVLDETGVAAALLLAVAGMGLRVYAPRHQMETEEHVKNGKMTPAEAHRQVKFLEIVATVVTLLGVAVLVCLLIEMAQ